MLYIRLIIALFLSTSITSCSSSRAPIPPGEIPTQQQVDSTDEQYGQQVLGQLTDQFPLDQNDENIFRVRNIVEKLTQIRENDRSVWHVYVLKDDDFKNAAATRGNHIFIWTGMLNAVENDQQLATILAHEIAHILAGHTQPSPQEAVNDMLSDLAGSIAGEVLYQQGGTVGALAGLGQLLASQVLKATIVNPESQRKELEADHIGLFLMAEAEYDPREAIKFWQAAQRDSSFGGSSTLAFLSTHPASETRIEQLNQYLPQALERYNLAKSGKLKHSTYESRAQAQPTEQSVAPDKWTRGQEELKEFAASPVARRSSAQWEVIENNSPVYANPDFQSPKVGSLSTGQKLSVVEEQRRWLKIDHPLSGYTPSFHHTPLE